MVVVVVVVVAVAVVAVVLALVVVVILRGFSSIFHPAFDLPKDVCDLESLN